MAPQDDVAMMQVLAMETKDPGGQEVEGTSEQQDKAFPRLAFALFGGVSRVDSSSTARGASFFDADSLDNFINVSIIAQHYQQHVFAQSPWPVDVFIHSWAPDGSEIAQELKRLYSPMLSKFESNTARADQIQQHLPRDSRLCSGGPWCQYSAASMAFSQQEALKLVWQGEERLGQPYKLVVLMRPDVLLWHPLDFALYDPERVTVNRHDTLGTGDFHFVMGSQLTRNFSKAFDSLSEAERGPHVGWLREFVLRHVTPGRQPAVDNIRPCHEQEVLRKICRGQCKVLPLKVFGVPREEMIRLPCCRKPVYCTAVRVADATGKEPS